MCSLQCLSRVGHRVEIGSHGLQVTLNHWARPVKSTDAGSIAEYGNDWTLMQMASTNNVECPEWLDWFHGGLQFQIECALHPP